jgi:hypothetical protein
VIGFYQETHEHPQDSVWHKFEKAHAYNAKQDDPNRSPISSPRIKASPGPEVRVDTQNSDEQSATSPLSIPTKKSPDVVRFLLLKFVTVCCTLLTNDLYIIVPYIITCPPSNSS